MICIACAGLIITACVIAAVAFLGDDGEAVAGAISMLSGVGNV
jgi:hypothetical protein